MKISHLLLISALLASSSVCEARSAKRGVCAKFTYAAEIELLEPGVSWWYNWANIPGRGNKGEVEEYNSTMDFVPMCWNGNYSPDNIRNYCKAHPEVKYILGFNEPNFKAQANMTPTQAAEQWPAVQALAKELGLKIVAPALNYSPDAPYYQPTQWMDEFVKLVGLDAFDYTAIHNYGGLGVMQTLGNQFYQKYGKPVWVTEFCYWPNETGYVAPETQISSMVETVEWLEKTPWIYRYAWFMEYGNSNNSSKPNYDLVEFDKQNVSLTKQGIMYVNLWDYNPEFYHPLDAWVAASDYHNRSLAMIGMGSNPTSPKPLEVSQFISGATIDYQFDVPQAGDYNLELTVSGVGRPSRFNPQLSIVAVNADGSNGNVLSAKRELTLSGADDVYTNETFAVTLPAGKQTIRIKDEAPYQPSGLRISALKLTSVAGIDGIPVDKSEAPVDVYTTLGVKVRSNVNPASATTGLPAGVYIVGSKKVLVK